MRGCMGAAKKMIYGPFFLVRFKTVGVKLEDGLDIKKVQRPGTGMRGCMGAAKETIYGLFFHVRFKTVGVKLEDGLDIKKKV